MVTLPITIKVHHHSGEYREYRRIIGVSLWNSRHCRLGRPRLIWEDWQHLDQIPGMACRNKTVRVGERFSNRNDVLISGFVLVEVTMCVTRVLFCC